MYSVTSTIVMLKVCFDMPKVKVTVKVGPSGLGTKVLQKFILKLPKHFDFH